MAQLFIDVVDGLGAHQKMDVYQLPSAQLVESVVIRSPSVDANYCEIYNADPASTSYGLPVRPLRDAVSTFHAIAAASNNATVVKNSAANLKAIRIANQVDTWIFFKTFNKATNPVPGSDTVKNTYAVQAGQRVDIIISDGGIAFSAGLAYAIVAGMADADNTAVVVNACTIDLEYK